MDAITVFLYSFAVAQMLFCALVLGVRANKSQLVLLYLALLLCSSCYLLKYIFSVESQSVMRWLIFLCGNSVLGIFWLVSLCLFGDHIKITPWHYAVATTPLLLPSLQVLQNAVLAVPLHTDGLIKDLGMLMELAFICHALLVTLKYWRDDLIQHRRNLRALLVGFNGVYLFLVIVLEQVFNISGVWLMQIESLVLASLTVWVNFYLMQIREMSLFPSNKTITKPLKTKKPSTEVASILKAMVEKSAYKQEGLTITQLAKSLNMYEYKLRNVINKELGYRNFNDFLNYYRIQDVTEKLTDPAFESIAILNLALDSGFRSLSSFNKAFKETHKLTPTEFRKCHCPR
jgi:AraC-like DNA-binding protein